jgi:CRISPR-associated protein Cas2
MIVLVSYDITDNKNRGKIFKYLKDYGIPMQKSVFELMVEGELFENIQRELCGYIKDKNDSIRFYKICETCRERILISGKGELIFNREFEII